MTQFFDSVEILIIWMTKNLSIKLLVMTNLIIQFHNLFIINFNFLSFVFYFIDKLCTSLSHISRYYSWNSLLSRQNIFQFQNFFADPSPLEKCLEKIEF